MREKIIQYLDHPELADEMGGRAAASVMEKPHPSAADVCTLS